MADDSKTTALTAITTLAGTDVFYVVDDPSGTPLPRKATTKQIRGESYGVIYITSSSATTLLEDTPAKVAGTTVLSANITAVDFDMPANNRLRYTGTETKVFFVEIAFSMTAASNNQVFEFHLYKGSPDALVPGSTIQRKAGTGADVGAVSLQGELTLATNEYVELWAENTSSDANATITKMNMRASALHI